MILKKLTFILMCLAGTCTFTACGSDGGEDGTEQQVRENDWMLEGRWQLKNEGSPGCAATILFRADGSGLYDEIPLKWYTYGSEIFISLYDGRTIKTSYSIIGATLTINGTGTYVTQLPQTGAWYAADAASAFDGGTFCYYFDENGDGIKYTYDQAGLTVKTKFKWTRRRGGISIMYRYVTEDKECAVADGSMNIDGEGEFTSTLPFYGRWQSVACNDGPICEGDDNYSTLDIYRDGGSSYFTCRYRHDDGTACHDAVFSGSLSFATSHSQYFDDQQLLLIKDLTSGTDTKAIHYRFFFHPRMSKVYLDLCTDNDFDDCVRYEFTGQH